MASSLLFLAFAAAAAAAAAEAAAAAADFLSAATKYKMLKCGFGW